MARMNCLYKIRNNADSAYIRLLTLDVEIYLIDLPTILATKHTVNKETLEAKLGRISKVTIISYLSLPLLKEVATLLRDKLFD